MLFLSQRITKNREKHWCAKFFEEVYAPILCHWAVKLVTMFWFAIYLIVSILGLTRMKVGFEVPFRCSRL